jgi:cobalt-zinc-cadmium efflux system membrane fusion protein
MSKQITVPILLLMLLPAGCTLTRENDPEGSERAAGRAQERNSEQAAADSRGLGFERQTKGGGRGQGRGGGAGGGRGRVVYHPFSISPAESKAIDIETVRATVRPIRAFHTAIGKVLAPPTRMARVSYPFPARISGIRVQIGEWVKKGQPLLALQSEEVGRAKSEFYKAIADLELARSNHDREKRLFERGVGAQKNVISADAEYKVAQAQLDAAEKKLHVLGFSEQDVQTIAGSHQINPEIMLFAPITGKIIEHNAVLGSMIDQTSELMTIMDPSILWVDAEIFEKDIAKIRIGQAVRISLQAFPGQSFQGKLTYIGDLMREDTRTITVRTEVENRDSRIKPGMFAEVTIFLGNGRRVVSLPSEAILDDNSEQIVFVRGEDHYLPKVVTVGNQQNGYWEITSGIREGEEVVTKGNYQLKSKLYDDLLKKAHTH